MREKDFNTGLRGVLFEVKHYERMGPALWLYGWLVLRQTSQANGVGLVLGGKPVSYREIEEETGFTRKTLERWMGVLRRGGYIETRTAPGGVIIRIAKAKKFGRHWGEGKGREGGRGRGRGGSGASGQATRLNYEEGDPLIAEESPQNCGGGDNESAGRAAFAKGIGSGIDSERNRKAYRATPTHQSFCEQNPKAEDGNGSEPETQGPGVDEAGVCEPSVRWGNSRGGNSGGSEAGYRGEVPYRPMPSPDWRTRREWRDEAVRREARVGEGPVVRGARQAENG
jgi:hypothetical protein